MNAALLVLLAVTGGTLATWRLHPAWPLPVRLAAGAVLGLTWQGLGGIAGAHLVHGGAGPGALLASSALLGFWRSSALRREARAQVLSAWRHLAHPAQWTRAQRLDAAAALLGTLALLAVFDRAVFSGPDGIATGVEHNFGDLPFHLSVAAGFAWGDNIPPQHPELAGARLTYPYLVDFLAALWTRAGLTLPQAFRWQYALMAPAIIVLLWLWGGTLTGQRGAARLVPLIVLLSGGLGFLWAAGDWRTSGLALGDWLRHLPRDYTIQPSGPLRWGNCVTTLLIPQRGFLLALPLLLIVWSLWADALGLGHADSEPAPAPHAPRLLGAGCVAGLLPLVHAHGFATVMALAAALALLFPARRAWTAFFAPALLLGAPQVLLLMHGSSLQARSFIAPHLGWDRGLLNPLVFWILNTGVFLPLLVEALVCAPTRARRFHAPFALLFIVPNLLRLSPWIWDNIKFLFPWFAGAAPFVAWPLARWSAGRRPQRAAAGLLVTSLTLAGALDLWRVASRQTTLPLFDAGAQEFARQVIAATPPHARIAHWPSHNAPTLLSGRPAVLGYPGHIWSQGLDGGRREADLAALYNFKGTPPLDDLLRRNQIDFIVVGPLEEARGAGPGLATLAHFPLAVSSGPYRLYDVRSATTGAARPAGPTHK